MPFADDSVQPTDTLHVPTRKAVIDHRSLRNQGVSVRMAMLMQLTMMLLMMLLMLMLVLLSMLMLLMLIMMLMLLLIPMMMLARWGHRTAPVRQSVHQFTAAPTFEI